MINMEYTEKLFVPKTSAAKVLIPLLDALKWHGGNDKIMEALTDPGDSMDTDSLVETMANLNFKHYKAGRFKASQIDAKMLPVLLVNEKSHMLILSIDGDHAVVFDGDSGLYRQVENNSIRGRIYYFQYADDLTETLIQQQPNWFTKLVYRFKKSLFSIGVLTLLLTLLDLLLPLFVILIYDRILAVHSLEPLMLTFTGILIYIVSSFSLTNIRSSILNYISTRMGTIISQETFTRLVYLSPNYTETASINSQIARIKDFEGLKKFVTSGSFIALFDLVFSSIYIVAIIIIGGWIGIIPVINLILLLLLGFALRPFHKIKMEKLSEDSAQRQQSLIEILKNSGEIKVAGAKTSWIQRLQKFSGAQIMSNYKLGDYVSLSNNIAHFTTNAAILIMIYGAVLQVFAGRMSTGALIGVLMLYWKIAGPIQGAFSLLVQINGLKKSIAQINRFMNLPQDTSLKTNMTITNEIKGYVAFSDVSIRYNAESHPALFNVSFKNAPGQMLGITGHDGAGKSTVLKLILGMYKPQAGRITIDKANIKQLEPLSLRRAISYAPENDMILTGTIRDNFRSYNPSITDGKIMDLAEHTGLSEGLKQFGFDLDTVLDEKMIDEMSVSLKKLLNLTRMLARDANLYLVDAPANYLDSQSVEKIAEVLRDLAKKKDAGVIVCTKDKQILSICDHVIQLNQGRVTAK